MYAFRVTSEAEISAIFNDGRIMAPGQTLTAMTRALPAYTQQSGRQRMPALLASALAVGTLFSAMVWMNVAPHHDKTRRITTVDLALTPPPAAPAQPAPAQPSEQKTAPAAPQQATPAPAPQPAATMAAALPVVADQPTVRPAPAAPPAPPAPPVVAKAPAGPAEVGDLSARLISFSPPAYPLESRRLHEEGTVVLALMLGVDGRVSEISVTSSSGSPRLDKAALEAVRKWRWAPLTRGGEAVQVRGHLKIPFALKS